MTIAEVRKETGLSNRDLAKMFDLSYSQWASNAQKETIETGIVNFYEFIKTQS